MAHAERLGEIVGQLVEVVGDSHAITPGPSEGGEAAAPPLGDESRCWLTAPSDHDLLAAFDPLDQFREVALCLVHADFGHTDNLNTSS